MKVRLCKVLAFALLAITASAPTFAQIGGMSSPGASTNPNTGSIIVYLRSQDGEPLPETAVPLIRLTSLGDGMPLPSAPMPVGVGWAFTGLATGNDYEVLVTANGYLPGHETVGIPAMPGATSEVIVFLRPADQELVFRRPAGQFVLAPKAAKEIQRALKDLQSGKMQSAQKHTQKAIDLAPANPYAQYVMGMTYLLSRQFVQAKPYLEKSVSIDPRESQSLRALGTVRYQLGDEPGAVDVLTKAVQLDRKSWRAEWLLAAAYLEEKQYAEARDHAERALKIDKQAAGEVELLLGRALAGLGDRERAAAAFDEFAARYPKNANASKAREWAEIMRQPPPKREARPERPAESIPRAPASPGPKLVSEPPVEVPPRPDWAPPDIDASRPFLVQAATCPVRQILARAGKNAEELVDSLQKFSAREDFQAIEIKHGDDLEKPSETSFSYLVFVNQTSPQTFDVKEVRGSGSAPAHLPTRVQDLGVAALALAFHPVIQKSLDWKCEGLGTWGDRPAWVVHFEQKPKAPNVLAWFQGPMHSYALPLKGRAWVSERSGQVLHLDTDLVSEIKPIDLKREHFSIDYKPVLFKEHHVELWLPESVDTYIQYQGHFLHYYHHFSDFKLFWVGASEKIGNPKEAAEERK
jgi:tetratricopeptide (TPR) repeat protein